jgi:hypothetical protein
LDEGLKVKKPSLVRGSTPTFTKDFLCSQHLKYITVPKEVLLRTCFTDNEAQSDPSRSHSLELTEPAFESNFVPQIQQSPQQVDRGQEVGQGLVCWVRDSRD